MRTIPFETTCDLALENSFSVLATEKGVIVKGEIGFHEGEETGWFEFYDKATKGDRWYAEGGLWFEGKKVIDYDGVFDLPHFIVKKLIQEGYEF